jgi:hypothetical protein
MPAENDGQPRQWSPIRNEGTKPRRSGTIPIAPPTNTASNKDVMKTISSCLLPKEQRLWQPGFSGGHSKALLVTFVEVSYFMLRGLGASGTEIKVGLADLPDTLLLSGWVSGARIEHSLF